MLGLWDAAKKKFPKETGDMIRLWEDSWHTSRSLTIAALAVIFLVFGVGGFVVGRQFGTTNISGPTIYNNITPTSAKNADALVTYGSTSSLGKSKVEGPIGPSTPRLLEDNGTANQGDFQIVDKDAPPRAPLPWPGTEFSSLSDAALKKAALEMAAKIRWLGLDLSSDRSKHAELIKQFMDEDRGTAAALAEEILARQKIYPPYAFQMRVMYPLALRGAFAGPNPLMDAAVFLEDRARMLPDADK